MEQLLADREKKRKARMDDKSYFNSNRDISMDKIFINEDIS